MGLLNSHSFWLSPSIRPASENKTKALELLWTQSFSIFLQSLSKILTVEMALKSKQTTTSSSITTAPTTAGGSPPKEAPISGKQKWLSPLLRTRRASPLNFFFEVQKLLLKLNSRRRAHTPHLIYKRAFALMSKTRIWWSSRFCLVIVTFASMNWTRTWWAPCFETPGREFHLSWNSRLNLNT